MNSRELGTGAFTFANTGTIEAGTDGQVSFLNVTLNNAGGTVERARHDFDVFLSDTTIQGGTLSTGGTGASGTSIVVAVASDANISEFDGSNHGALTVDGYVGVFAGAQLELTGTINIDGVNGLIDVAGPDNNSCTPGNILISGPVTLSTDGASGNPQITLGTSNEAIGQILAATGGGTLNNNVWISGVGKIGAGDGTLTVNNKSGGLIQANPGTSVSGTLIIDLGNTLTNLGTLEAANGATLELSHTTISGGSIDVDADGTLLLSNADLSGGVTVHVFGSGTDVGKIEIAGATTITDSTITDSITDTGAVITLIVDSGATLTYDGADTIDSNVPRVIDNNGSIVYGGTLSISSPKVTFEDFRHGDVRRRKLGDDRRDFSERRQHV